MYSIYRTAFCIVCYLFPMGGNMFSGKVYFTILDIMQVCMSTHKHPGGECYLFYTESTCITFIHSLFITSRSIVIPTSSTSFYYLISFGVVLYMRGQIILRKGVLHFNVYDMYRLRQQVTYYT